MPRKTKKSAEEKPEEVLQDEKDEGKNLAEKLSNRIRRINKRLKDIDDSICFAIFILSTVIAWGAAAIAKGDAGFLMFAVGCITLAITLAITIGIISVVINESKDKEDECIGS